MKNTIGKEFMNQTEYPYLNKSDQQNGLKQPLVEMPYDTSISLIDLPQPSNCELEIENIRELIDNRHSLRKYSQTEITLEALSYLLSVKIST